MKSSSSNVSSNVIFGLAALTKMIGISGISRRNLIQAKSSDQDRNSAMTKSTFASKNSRIAFSASSRS